MKEKGKEGKREDPPPSLFEVDVGQCVQRRNSKYLQTTIAIIRRFYRPMEVFIPVN